MKRKIMVVTAAYGHDQVRAAGGQTAMLPIIAEAGADGVEIRRELLTEAELKTLSTMASAPDRRAPASCPAPARRGGSC